MALVAGLAVEVVAGIATGAAGAVAAWPFALVGPLAFALQEHLERALGGAGAWGAALEPTFALGLALQLPFAVAAWVAARSVLRAVRCIAAGPAPVRTRVAALVLFPAPSSAPDPLPSGSPLSRCSAGRAPPPLVV